MRHMYYFHAYIILLTLINLSNLPQCLGEIKDTHIRDDSRPMILFERFGFGHEGHVKVTVKNISWRSKHQNMKLVPSSMGFFLVREVSFPRILNESEYMDNFFCMLESRYVRLILKFDGSTYNGSTIIDEPDEYSLVFGNCQPEFEVSMDVHTEMYNVVQNGRVKDFLPVGQGPLPKLYFILFLVYGIFFGIWFYICYNQRLRIDKIHLIMGVLLLFKALKMVCASEDKMYVRKTGTPHGWDVPFYVFGFFKGVVLFTVMILIGTGWSFIKPYLQDREKKVLMTVIPLQVVENVAAIVIGETGPTMKDWLTWNQIFLLIDVICCCAVFFPIIWSIRSMREASKSDGKAIKNLEKLLMFKQFYIVMVGYLYFTRIVVPAIGAVVSYLYEWVVTASAEGASLSFYIFIFYNFQPIEKSPYLRVDDDDHDEVAAGQVLDEDDSFEL